MTGPDSWDWRATGAITQDQVDAAMETLRRRDLWAEVLEQAGTGRWTPVE